MMLKKSNILLALLISTLPLIAITPAHSNGLFGLFSTEDSNSQETKEQKEFKVV